MAALVDIGSIWEQKVFEFGVTLPIPEVPKPSADWGSMGIALKFVFPGAIYCGNPDAEENCSLEVIKPLTIPGFSVALPFPPEIKLPPLKFRIVFPPKVVLAGFCPNYPEQEAPPAPSA